MLVVLSLVLSTASAVWADQGTADSDTADSDTTPAATAPGGAIVGINGHYRVGRQTAIRLEDASAADADAGQTAREELTLETMDGDGVRVRFGAYPPFRGLLRDPREIGYVVPGSEAAPLTILRQNDGTSVPRNSLPNSTSPRPPLNNCW